jgi:Lar family restriction alleviation protein
MDMTDAPVTQAALRPCPFCGSDEVGTTWLRVTDDVQAFGVMCAGCKVEIAKASAAEAIAAWNTRQPESGVADDVANKLRLAMECANYLPRVAEEAEENGWHQWGADIRSAAATITTLAALAAVPSLAADQWQTIDTAPKDGSEFLAVCGHDDETYWLLRGTRDGSFFYNDGLGDVYVPCVTHWMPLPPAPDQEGERM